MVSLNPALDLDQGKGHYRIITQLKRKFPQLKILLSVGGEVDIENREKYLTLLESSGARIAFINSAYSMVKTYEFDGLDLAWEFPPNKPKKIKSSIGMRIIENCLRAFFSVIYLNEISLCRITLEQF